MAPVTRSQKPLPGLPQEVWIHILKMVDLPDLVNLKILCRSSYKLLDDMPELWVAARQKAFGPDCPAPPLDLTEWQYATLLCPGRCQERGCKKRKPTRVCWAMQKRLCQKHFNDRLFKKSYFTKYALKYPGMLKTLPHFRYKKHKHAVYMYTGYQSRLNDHKGWDKKAFKKRLRQFQRLPQSDSVPSPEIVELITQLKREQKEQMVELEHCEKYFFRLPDTIIQMC